MYVLSVPHINWNIYMWREIKLIDVKDCYKIKHINSPIGSLMFCFSFYSCYKCSDWLQWREKLITAINLSLTKEPFCALFYWTSSMMLTTKKDEFNELIIQIRALNRSFIHYSYKWTSFVSFALSCSLLLQSMRNKIKTTGKLNGQMNITRTLTTVQ